MRDVVFVDQAYDPSILVGASRDRRDDDLLVVKLTTNNRPTALPSPPGMGPQYTKEYVLAVRT